ncbi:plasmid mobilization protein [Thiobacillus sedimenti]|uniref:Ribbon-helix-helix protein, CopG family n=1 Tax=Thiobacillus sedimenti TaxID=3110231 RepID=A0ABZ1CMI1_9PROT|nr:ribbon-helix-helix protein, CopG family [Thiobacillus sp. SCUT-2]WRS40607.1 ribbon-helix-helix protein, CopG family [Thiobacillus sp. SCUT-2]
MTRTSKPITVHVTAKEKRHIARMAKDAGTSLEDFIRRAATSYTPIPPDEAAILERMTDLLNQSTARADAAIDDALACVDASNIRICALENRETSGPHEHKLVLKVNLPAGMDPAVAESLKPRIEQTLELLTLAKQSAAIEHADRIARLLLGKIEPNTGLVEARLARLNTVREILEQGEWLTAEQLNALQPNPPTQRNQPASDWKHRGLIFAVNHGGQDYFARYQFDEAYQPLPIIREILREFGTVADTWEIAAWFQFPNGWISRPGTAGEPMAPKDALDQRDALLHAVSERHKNYVA